MRQLRGCAAVRVRGGINTRAAVISNEVLKRRLRVAASTLAAIALGLAAALPFLAEDAADASLGYVVVDGILYPLSTQDAKSYRREVQRFGGKTALIIDDFGRWFAGLWRGRALLKTLAWMAAGAALILYLLARGIGRDPPSSSGRE